VPELPEVESLRASLARTLVGRTCLSVEVREQRLRRRVDPVALGALVGRKFVAVGRRGKYLLIELSGQLLLLVHLGMSGSLTRRQSDLTPAGLSVRHDHLTLALDDGSRLVYNDPRRFGLVRLLSLGERDSAPELRILGAEPLEDRFNGGWLWRQARRRRAALKNLLMDQRIVAGIGNIYAAEILFCAAVRPTRRSSRLTREQAARIVEATKQVLQRSIGRGGTTFRNYLDGRGVPGRFAAELQVYGRAGKPCRRCRTPIGVARLGQRATFYCPKCQR
jgi:formamidopyrimidine-DNA glycosylase